MSTSREAEGSLELDLHWTERILAEFLRRELHRTGCSRFVVGLSGGIDSAVSTYLAARALGAENVFACRLPFRSSSESSLSDAQEVIDDLGLPAETVDISAMVDGFAESAGDADSLRLGNVMARVRMALLYDRSAKHRALVLGTSNKTELLLGYGTLHGDMASALNPIGDLYKSQVRALAKHLGVPRSICEKPPSADLWPDQNDEQDLGMTYAQIDPLLARMVDARMSRAALIEQGFSAERIDELSRRIVRSQFKRRMPVIAKIGTRSIGWDFLYPRDWQS